VARGSASAVTSFGAGGGGHGLLGAVPQTESDRGQHGARLLALGADGGYILSPAHAVEGDVPLENMLAFIDEALSQPGFKA